MCPEHDTSLSGTWSKDRRDVLQYPSLFKRDLSVFTYLWQARPGYAWVCGEIWQWEILFLSLKNIVREMVTPLLDVRPV